MQIAMTLTIILDLTISNNQLECESEVVKLNDLLITCKNLFIVLLEIFP